MNKDDLLLATKVCDYHSSCATVIANPVVPVVTERATIAPNKWLQVATHAKKTSFPSCPRLEFSVILSLSLSLDRYFFCLMP